MDRFDFVVVGAGTAGEAGANMACQRGASVAIMASVMGGVFVRAARELGG